MRLSIDAQGLRLVSGLILFAFVALHLVNHALALWSLEAMDQVQVWRTEITRSLTGRIVLGGAFVVHLGLNVSKIVARKYWRMRGWGFVQILTGLIIPVLVIPHAVGMNIPEVLWAVDVTYAFAVLQLWPAGALEKFVLTVVAWTHGCIGVTFWLRSKSWFNQAAPLLVVSAIAIPVLGFLGYTVAGKLGMGVLDAAWLTDERRVWIAEQKDLARTITFWSTVAVCLLAAVVYRFFSIRSRVRVFGDGAQAIPGRKGQTLLEICRSAGHPHSHVCGGKGRCSTCRVRVVEGAENLSPRSDREMQVTRRFGLPDNVRLACQSKVLGQVHMQPLVAPETQTVVDLAMPDPLRWGQERTLTILFADIRGFTTFSENQLPYDVVFFLNRFMEFSTKIIEAHEGHLDKFMGDGIMAIFGIDGDPERAAQNAIAASHAILDHLEDFQREFAWLLNAPLKVGVGLHSGLAVVGRVGGRASHGARGQITVIGDVVNTAARIEGMCKDLRASLLVSESVLDTAGDRRPRVDGHVTTPRGREKSLTVFSLRSQA
ncbi:MAG: adenylate/guanylate cyclase domain-containing protein [Pseudomonadota bacterium]